MTTRRKPQTTKSGATTTRASRTRTKPSERKLGIALISAGAAALGLGATLAAVLIRRRSGLPTGHAAPDLAADAPSPQTESTPSNAKPDDAAAAPEMRAPEHFRPDPTAVPSADEREALRPATGPAPSLAADRGSVPGETQGAA